MSGLEQFIQRTDEHDRRPNTVSEFLTVLRIQYQCNELDLTQTEYYSLRKVVELVQTEDLAFDEACARLPKDMQDLEQLATIRSLMDTN